MSPDYLLTLLITYKYWLFLPLMIFEGPLVAVAAGVLSAAGYVNFWVMFALAVLGDIIGDTLYYALGRFGSDRLKDRFAKWFKATEADVQSAKESFRRSAVKHLFLGKLLHGVGVAVLFAAGVAEVPYAWFIWLNTIVTVPKSFILLLIGFYFGSIYYRIGSFLDILGYLGIAALILGIIYYFYKKQRS